MLAIFHKAFAHPPEELNSPASKKQKLPVETLNDFLSAHSYPKNAFSMTFGDAAVLAYARPDTSFLHHQRVIQVRFDFSENAKRMDFSVESLSNPGSVRILRMCNGWIFPLNLFETLHL